jgi:hypothetical protein
MESNLEKGFLDALSHSFEMYKKHGARSNQKLKPLHKFIAETVQHTWGKGFEICYLGDASKEATIEGKYYSKDIDITVVNDKNKAVFCVGIKFVTSNYKQNANNYFENMMGEAANIQALGNLPYAQLIILRHEMPYYSKNETEIPSKIEIINDKDIQKYLKLVFDNPQSHRPTSMCVPIVDIDETNYKAKFTNLEKAFSKEIADLLSTKLSLKTFFEDINNYKNYYISK